MGVKLPGLSIKHFFETVSIPIKTLSVKIFIFFLDYWQVPFLPLSTGFFQTNKVRDQLLHQYQQISPRVYPVLPNPNHRIMLYFPAVIPVYSYHTILFNQQYHIHIEFESLLIRIKTLYNHNSTCSIRLLWDYSNIKAVLDHIYRLN